jgi:hypothetical protein
VPYCPHVILKYSLELQSIVLRYVGQPVEDENDIILTKLCTVLLSVDDEPSLKLAADVVEHLMSNKRFWACYKIGCVAANNSRHEMSFSIFSQMTQVVSRRLVLVIILTGILLDEHVKTLELVQSLDSFDEHHVRQIKQD